MVAYPTPDGRLALRPAAHSTLPSSLPSRRAAARRSSSDQAALLKSLWLCAYFPNLSLEAAGYETGDARPCAIFEENGAQRLVYRASAAASAAGVTRGIRLSQAYALCPALQVRVRDATAEMRRLGRLAAWAGRFTPMVSVQPPQACLLEISGSLRLFGGLASLKRALGDGLCALGTRAHTAVTPTPLASLLLASQGRPAEILEQATLRSTLGKLSINALPLKAGSIRRLTGAGVRDLHDLWRLPREGIARRLKPELLDILDRALGARPDPRPAFCPAPHFTAELALPWESDDTAVLVEAARCLIAKLGGFLRQRDAAITRLRLDLRHARSSSSRLKIGMRHGVRDEGHLLNLVKEHLHRLRLPAPVLRLELTTAEIQPFAAENQSLFASTSGAPRLEQEKKSPNATNLAQESTPAGSRLRSGSPDCLSRLTGESCSSVPKSFEALSELALGRAASLPEPVGPFPRGNLDWSLLLEQLQARLGAGAVRGLKLVEDHRPERTWGYTDPGSRASASDNRRRPLWLLPIPRPLTSRRGNPWRRGYLSIIVGPERIENGWWDGRDISRDYYIATDTDGSRLWIFRDLCRDRWYLHGLFG